MRRHLSCFCDTFLHHVYDCPERSRKMHADSCLSSEIDGFCLASCPPTFHH